MATILVVEDRASTRELLKVILRSRHKVVAVAEAAEAIKLARSSHPDLVLLNLHLGKHKGGLTVCRILRRDFDPTLAQIPILVITEMVSQADIKDALAAGATDCINNPPDPFALLELINTRLPRLHL